MRIIFKLLNIVCIVGCVYIFVISDSIAAVSLSGSLKSDFRFQTKSRVPIEDTYGRAFAELKSSVNENVDVLISTDLRYYHFSDTAVTSDLTKNSSNYFSDISLWEAYAIIYDFYAEGLSLKVGKQRISWGKADTLNPTDNLNPDDYSDIFSFGEKIPTTAIDLSYSWGDDFLLQFVFLPSVRPVLLPRGNLANSLLGGSSLPIPNGVSIGTSEYEIKLPSSSIDNSMQALKFGWKMFNVDFSLSYFRGYDDTPIIKGVELTQVAGTLYDASLGLGYNKQQVIGLDFASELFKIGYWFEGAYFIPEQVNANVVVDVPASTSTVEILSSKPYFKYTVGIDYTFKNGVYINIQQLRGIFAERGKDNLNDYLFAQIEKKYMNDKLKISLGVATQLTKFEDIEDKYGIILIPEIEYHPYDAVELVVGVLNIWGKGDAALSGLKDYDQVYLKMKVSF